MNANAYTIHNSDFTERIVVVCPKCGQQATVLGARANASVAENEEHVHFACTACSYAVKYGNTPKFTTVRRKGRAHRGRNLLPNTACDPFFGFRLWYIIETSYGTIWAYNLAHLNVIELYIADHKCEPTDWPHWMKDAKHRELLLKLIQRLKAP